MYEIKNREESIWKTYYICK